MTCNRRTCEAAEETTVSQITFIAEVSQGENRDKITSKRHDSEEGTQRQDKKSKESNKIMQGKVEYEANGKTGWQIMEQDANEKTNKEDASEKIIQCKDIRQQEKMRQEKWNKIQ